MKMMYTDSYLEETVDGITNFEKHLKLYKESNEALPPPTLQGLRSQVFAVHTHSVGKERLELLKNSGIPILVCTGDTDHLVNPKASEFLREVCISILM